ncbi:DEAD/DEAH box helicase [Pseudorhodobacter wandonensis]|jgi:ATP-dependent RNA helicase DeaD|uniref:DEAD/DEAH box helicase n=1 Tax=Pseudorhodobacter wandonensis TaxID=1120568 RepID=UPI00067BB8BE|nr:DEAD/DEAH box helicase [Pseudorhodobacter wandonensis]
MENVNIAGPLAAALEAKGYASLTPVQEAMLAPEVEGRDLLVSAQTGSGKTVAFGIAIANDLLNGADRFLFADVPMALIIAPTRELALQVARELDWLYGEAGARIATCVGGMDYRTEKRSLDRGAHIVVGTPGRLRDHIDRKSLDLSGLRAAVLDEADEMLDLGFRDDLEYILSQAPEDRRTLMFSATVPKAIAALAKEFQNDALRIQTAGEAKQHVDIEYRALSVQMRDRENAIFNLLRYYEAPTAIVFCKTRAAVTSLMGRMGNRGFKVVALSGELSQAERTNALSALRNGRANVCIATDVAARGIDLPGLDLVIHADLPSNSETLLHRSGRTGRAGSKGVSALIVVPSEFRKAQRLVQGAKLVVEWGSAPSAEEVQERDDQRILEHPALGPNDGEDGTLAQVLLDRFGAEQVAQAFVTMWRQGRSSPEVLSDVAKVGERPEPKPRGEFGASVWYTISVGHTGRAEARWLLPKICEAGGITKDGIGAIRVQTELTYVQIGKDVADKFGAGVALEEGVEMKRMDGEPAIDRDRPERPVRAPREKPAYKPKPSRFVEDDAPMPERKPYTKREPAAKSDWSSDDGAPKGFEAREADKPKRAAKPYAKAEGAKPYGEKKPYAKADGAKSFGDKKPYAKKADGDKKPWVKREEGDGKPWEKRDAAPRKPYAKRADAAEGAKPYAKREDGAKPYAPRGASPEAGGERKPRWKAEEGTAKPRSAGFKSHGGKPDGEGRPARSAGFKSHSAEGKSFGKPGGKPAGKTFAKPAKPRANDTSKRFVPPKKG